MNVKVFQRKRGFLNTFLAELRLFSSDVRLFKKFEALLKHLNRKRLVPVM
jgi:hypothetical protein